MLKSWIIGLFLVLSSFLSGMAQQPTLIFPNIDAPPGSTVCFEALASNFDSIFTIQFSFNWDPTVMQFVSVQGFGFPNVSSGNFGQTFVDEGKLSFSWFPFTGQPLTLPDGTPVFELCFEIIGQPGESAQLIVGSDPTTIEVTKPGSFSNVGLGSTGGILNVVGSQTLELATADKTVEEGASFSLDVTSAMFEDIINLQTSLSWDASVIQFDSVGNFQLPGLGLPDFDQTLSAGGVLGLDWTSPGGVPVNFPDSIPMFSIYFTAIGQSGDSSLVEFTDELFPISATSTNGIAVSVETDTGIVRIYSPFVICTEEVVVNQSDTICIPLVASGFDSILSMQFTLQWDTSMLEFVGVGSFAIPYLDLQEFNLTQINLGLLSVSWFDEDFSSKTLPDSTVIFEVCFVAVGPIGDSTQLQFVDQPTKIEVRDKDGQIIGFEDKTGTVFIESAIRIVDTIITKTNCGAPDGGAIDINLAGGTPPYTFLWSTGDTTEDIGNLFAGDYTVTIIDAASNTHTLVSSFFVDGDFLSPVVSTLEDTLLLDCKQLPLLIEGTGPLEPQYVYEWSSIGGNVVDTLANPLQAEVSQPGLYLLTVTDTTNGCGNFDSTVVIATTPFPISEAGPSRALNCIDTTAELNGQGSSFGPEFQYVWSTPDGQILNGTNTLSPTIGLPGLYILTVIDTVTACATSSSTEVTVDTASPYIDLGDEVPFACKDASVILTPDSIEAGFAISYHWTALVGDLDTTTAEQQQVVVLSPGVYQIVVENADNGCIASSAVTVFPDTIAPSIQLDTPAVLSCVDQQALLVAAPVLPGTLYEYKWTALTGGTVLSGGESAEAVAGDLGIYRLVVTDPDNGCKTIADIEILEDPEAPVSIAGGDTALTCILDTLQLNGFASALSGSFSAVWQAENGGNIVSGGNTLQPVINQTGLYTLTVTDDTSGCSTTSSLEVILDTIPPVAEAGQDKQITCIAISVLIGSPSSSQGADFKYQWTTPDGNISSADTLVVATANQPGSYFLQVTNIRTGCVSFDSVTVTKSADIPIVDPGTDRNLTCSDTAIWLGGPATTSGPDISYLWSTIDGNVLIGEDSTYAYVDSPGEYTLVVTNVSLNCTSFKKVTVGIDTVAPEIELADSFGIDCNTPETILDASGSSSGADLLISWESDTGILLEGVNTLSPLVTGQGLFTLTILNQTNGCLVSDTTFLSADTAAPSVVIVSDGFLSCSQSEVVLDGSASDNGSGYSFGWSPATGLSDPDLLVTEATNPGSYTLSVINLSNGCSDSATADVLIDTLAPTVTIAFPDELNCQVVEVTLDGSASSSGPEFEYLWTALSGGIAGGQSTAIATANQAGLFILTVTDTSNDCQGSDTALVAIDTISPIVDAGQVIDMGCTEDPVTLSASIDAQGDSVLIQWTGTTVIDGGNTADPLVQGPGTFVVQVTNLDNGCQSSDATEVTMVNILADADAGSDQSLCPGEDIALSAILPVGSSGNWTSPTGGVIDAPMNPVTLVSGGVAPGLNSFIWSLSTPDCPDYDSDTVIVDIENSPVANGDSFNLAFGGGNFTLDVLENDQLPGQNWTVTLSGQPNQGRAEVNGLGEIELETPPQFVGTLTLSYILCNDNCPGLCDTAQVVVVVEQPATFNIDSIFVPNVITPNGDGANDRLIFDFLDIFSERFPNPQLVVFNRWGDVLFETEQYQNDWEGTDQNGRDLPEGTYYYVLRITVADGNIIKGDVTILR